LLDDDSSAGVCTVAVYFDHQSAASGVMQAWFSN
jgi:hypothetical protein